MLSRAAAMPLHAAILLLVSACATAGPQSLEDQLQPTCPSAAQWLREKRSLSVTEAPPPRPTPTNPELARDLAKASAADKTARERVESQEDFARVQSVDRENLALLRRIDATRTTPTAAQVGLQGLHDFWLLVQHADEDPGLQSAVLARIAPGDAAFSPQEIALLSDRVAVREGRAQTWGTQLDPKTQAPLNGIEAPDGLEARRTTAGLMPMADYQCMMKALQGS